MKITSTRWGWLLAVVSAMGLAGCGGVGASSSSDITSSPAGLDLLYISDSSGWEVGEAYRVLAERATGQPVRLVDWRASGLPMVDALDRIKAEPRVVAEADIVVLWGNPTGSGAPESAGACIISGGNPTAQTAADWAPFRDLAGEALDAIWAARGGQPTLVRVTDIYNADPKDWKTRGIYDQCTRIWELQSDAMRQAAATHGAAMVSAWDALNGPRHDQNPADAGYLAGDGVHLSPAGGRIVAQALAAEGFEPAAAP